MREGVVNGDVGDAVGNEVINETNIGGGEAEGEEFIEKARVPDLVKGLGDVK